jgi:hypothetical protein
MTYRQGEPFTIKNLNTIKETINQKKTISASGVGTIDASYEPFYEFTPDFIDATTIQKLRDGEPAIPKELYKNVDAVGFFDSLHDFKSDFMDCQGNIRGVSNSWNYKKFGFTFLLNGGYSNLLQQYGDLLIQRAYSYLNRIPRPLNQDNLENYFSIGNIYDIIDTQDNSKGNIYILPNTRGSTTDKTSIYNNLIALFAKYKDTNFNNKIKLVFDFQLNLFDIIQVGRTKNANNDGFCVLYTAEIMTDPAPKPKAAKIDEIFGCENWYIEILNVNEPRSYDAQNDNVRGNVDVSFNKIIFSNENDLENAEFTVNVTYSNEGQNETIDVKMNSKSNTIQNIKNMIRNTIEKLTNVSDRFDYYKDSIKDRIGFYDKFNSETLSQEDANNYKKKYTRYFARKRLGDTLEGRVCKKDKQKELLFKNVIKESKSTIIRNKTTYKLSNNIINLTDKASIKDAVLVTHDRMLFSYAVINKIPTILDLQEHMILFIPPEEQTGGSGRPGPFSDQPPGPFSDQHSGPFSDQYNNVITNDNDNDDDDKILIKKQYNIQLTSVGDNKIVIESIKRNVGDAIYYIYHQIETIPKFLEEVNRGLQNKSLEYAYLGEYFNNALIILPSENFEQRVEDIKAEIQASVELRNTRYNSLLYNNLLLFIQTSDNSILQIKNNFTQQTPDVRDENTTRRWISNMDVKFTTSNKEKTYYYNDQAIYNFINQIESKNLFEMTGEIKNDILTFYQEPTNNEERDINQQLFEFAQKYEKPLLFIAIIFAFIIASKIKALFDSIMKGGAVDGHDSNEETPLYVKILSADFNFLNNKENLFEQNITCLYFLFNLLQSYEVSFIGYQEGIDAFYTKIDESYILSEMIGVTNYIPHNIEFYVFLKLLLKDYDEDKVNKINYALFEYYLYNSKQSNQIYSRFQDIKSYLLKTNYEIEITEENIQIIQNENKETLDYFDSIMKTTSELSQQIINENYNAYQDSNFEKVYENVSNYNLTLKGFTDMKSEFITKTTDVISSMVNKGLLTQYSSQATQEIQSSQTSQTSQKSQLMNEPKETTLLVNTVNKEVDEKAKGIVTYNKLTPFNFENTLAYGAGKHNKQYNRTRQNSRKYRKHKKTNKNNNKNKKRTKSLKKKNKKTKTCKKK